MTDATSRVKRVLGVTALAALLLAVMACENVAGEGGARGPLDRLGGSLGSLTGEGRGGSADDGAEDGAEDGGDGVTDEAPAADGAACRAACARVVYCLEEKCAALAGAPAAELTGATESCVLECEGALSVAGAQAVADMGCGDVWRALTADDPGLAAECAPAGLPGDQGDVVDDGGADDEPWDDHGDDSGMDGPDDGDDDHGGDRDDDCEEEEHEYEYEYEHEYEHEEEDGDDDHGGNSGPGGGWDD